MESTVALSYDEMLDRVEVEMTQMGIDNPELKDFSESAGFFCGGMYIKPVVVKAGSYLTSKVHAVEHPFFLMEGEIDLFIKDEEGGVVSVPLRSPHIDISTIGTRRFGYCKSDILWVTVHRTDRLTEEEVEGEVITPRENKLLTEFLTNFKIENR